MKKKRGIPEDWKRVAASIFLEHPKWNAAQLHRQLGVYYGESNAPGLSAVQKARAEIAMRYKAIQAEGGEDKEWSMGVTRYYPVPLGALDCVTTLQRLFHAEGKWLTVRRAQWIAALHPVLWPLLKDHPLRLAQIAAFYSRREQIAEVNNSYLDTTDLDKVFLEARDVSAAAVTWVWPDFYGAHQVEPFGWETGLLLDFVKLLLETGAKEAIAFADAHPEVWPEAESWMVFQTRKGDK